MTGKGTSGRLVDGLAALAVRYDGFLLDQFGVLHDGTTVYPGVVACLEALKQTGKRVVILSNSGTRREANIERLARLGIPAELYEDFVTSGEVTLAVLSDPPVELCPAGRAEGPLRCLPLLDGPAERAIVESTAVTEATDIATADFLLLASFGRTPPSRDAFDGTLAEARARGLTLLCANPDITGFRPEGLIPAPGAFAADYEAAGGKVLYIGKPHPLIYRHALERLAPLPAGRVIGVGDSLAHDVAGAQGAGLAAALIIEGIHREELGNPADGAAFDSRLAALERQHHARPDYLLRRLAW